MRIICVYSLEDYARVDKPLSSLASIPFGISSIASCLQKTGRNIELIVLTPETKIKRLLGKTIQDFAPQIICFTAVTTQFPIISRAIEIVKSIDNSILTILGGSYASLMPEMAIQAQGLDVVCIGEGEAPLLDLVKRMEEKKDITTIENLWFKKGKKIIKNKLRKVQEDLDQIASMDRNLWLDWIDDTERMASVLVGRGCPNRCSYCSNHTLANLAEGEYVRFRSPDSILKEVRSILQDFPGVKTIFFDAETLTADLSYTFELLDRIESFNKTLGRSINYGTNIAINRHIAKNEDFFSKLKAANFKFLNVGIESGSEEIRKSILRRPHMTNQHILDFRELASLYSIDINMYVLVGIPNETRKEFQKTVSFVRFCAPTAVFISIFHPYPGTDMYDTILAQKLHPSLGIDCLLERRRAKFSFPGFTKLQINLEFLLFEFKVYYGKKPLLLLIARTIRQLTLMSFILNKLYRYLSSRNRVFYLLGKKISSFWY